MSIYWVFIEYLLGISMGVISVLNVLLGVVCLYKVGFELLSLV